MNNQIAKSKPKPKSSSLKRVYLLLYNAVALGLWTVVLGRTLVLLPFLIQHDGLHKLRLALWPLHPIAQGVALLEVVHATLGVVRASPVTTAMQVASRILVVFGILQPFPGIVVTKDVFRRDVAGTESGPAAFLALIIAHGVTEVIRYGFFVWKEGISEQVPDFLLWLRYNTFFVLYPLGISSECWLIWLALPAAKNFSWLIHLLPLTKQFPWMTRFALPLATNFSSLPSYELFLKAVLVIYIPGSYILYTHMMSQRKKVLKGKRKQA